MFLDSAIYIIIHETRNFVLIYILLAIANVYIYEFINPRVQNCKFIEIETRRSFLDNAANTAESTTWAAGSFVVKD